MSTATKEKLTATQQLLKQGNGVWPPDGTNDAFAVVLSVTPSIAGDWLDHNVMNRPLREVTVKKYANIIAEGRWVMNGDTIKFDPDGNLLDGQHRLTAIIVADKTVPCMVAFNIPKAAFATLDRPKKRSSGDILSLRGEVDTARLAAALTWLWKYSTGRWRVNGPEGSPEPTDLLRLLDEAPDIRESLRVTGGSRFTKLGGNTALTVAHYVLGQNDPELRDKFFEMLGNPANLDEFHPIFKLRERLLSDRLSKYKMPQHERIAIIFKAWNAWRLGRDVRQLAWRGGTTGANEAFPEPL